LECTISNADVSLKELKNSNMIEKKRASHQQGRAPLCPWRGAGGEVLCRFIQFYSRGLKSLLLKITLINSLIKKITGLPNLAVLKLPLMTHQNST
jgi:hypothetical protein